MRMGRRAGRVWRIWRVNRCRVKPERWDNLIMAPNAVQVADRFDLVPNVGAALDEVVRSRRRRQEIERAQAAWEAGRALPLERAVACALELVPTRATSPETASAGRLTAREREVVALIARGFSNRRIADELVMTESTVVRHVSNILGKLGATARSEVAVWAVRRDWTPGRTANVQAALQVSPDPASGPAGEAGRMDDSRTDCCIVGGGPGGAMLALLLPCRGVAVILLEAHADFEREFRGDTVHR
jgi:DNA-binding CsgD family transcriptional regulator